MLRPKGTAVLGRCLEVLVVEPLDPRVRQALPAQRKMDEEALRAMLPMGFGKKAPAKQRPTDEVRNTKPIAAESTPAPAAPGKAGQISSKVDSEKAQRDDSDDDGLTPAERAANEAALGDRNEHGDSDSETSSVDLGPEPQTAPTSDTLGLPIQSEVHLAEHTKSLSALAVDPSGARVATGSYDYDVRLWDFGGMTASLKPFKTFEPFGSYWIHDLAWSSNGERLLAVSGTSQPKLFDRNGNELATYKKGDVYLRDMKQTSGHVAELSSCSWMNDDTFVTASADSTIRLWDPENKAKQKTVINVRSRDRGARTKVTAHTVSHDGARTLAAACEDGALHLWSTSGSYSRPNATVEGAHTKGTTTSSIVFSHDDRVLATRGGDDTVKLWDVRSLKKPVAEKAGLPNAYAQTSLIFSPDGRCLLTGTSASNAGIAGAIEVLSHLDLSSLKTVSVTGKAADGVPAAQGPLSVVRLQWHPRINQLFATTSVGSCSVFFSGESSVRGALLSLPKAAKTRRAASPTALMGEGPIIVPGAQDATARGQGLSHAAKKRRLAREAASDPRVPQRPMTGPGRGGRIGVAATRHVVDSLYGDAADARHEDPREALLKYAEKPGEEGKNRTYTKAWEHTQPKTFYRQEEDSEDK
ncbi:unnamed protein product [Parajaminaea phylloscopi]